MTKHVLGELSAPDRTLPASAGPYPKELDDASFRKFLLHQTGRTPELVKTIAPALQSKILKPQQLLHDDDDYYIATDMVTNTYYVCYRNLLMVDIDFYKDEQTLTREQRTEQLLDKLRSYCEGRDYRFRVFDQMVFMLF